MLQYKCKLNIVSYVESGLVVKVSNENDKKDNKFKIDEKVVTKPINDLLSNLDIEWRTVITLRYGLNGEPPKSVQEVAEILGTTTDAINSLEANALRYFYTKKD